MNGSEEGSGSPEKSAGCVTVITSGFQPAYIIEKKENHSNLAGRVPAGRRMIMNMNGIDVSNWQAGINLAAVPADFVVMKATEGTSYVSPDCDRQYQQAKAAGRCLGVYHYANGGDVQAEADFFLNNIKGYIGEAILVLDWEATGNPAFGKNDFNWCKSWLDYVYSKTNVRPMLYCSQSVMSRFAGIGDYGMWIAQYANDDQTGYQETPWNEGAYACAMRQYSSHGRLSGYNGDLDLDKFYGDREAWNQYAGKGNAIVPTDGGSTSAGGTQTPSAGGTTYTVQSGDTLSGIAAKFGTTYQHLAQINGIADPNKIYAGQVIKIDGTSSGGGTSTYTVQPGDTLSGIATRYGTTYQYLAQINGIADPDKIYAGQVIKVTGASNGGGGAQYYTIKSGDTLSGIAARYGTTYQNLAAMNGIADPDKIYAGQTIRVK